MRGEWDARLTAAMTRACQGSCWRALAEPARTILLRAKRLGVWKRNSTGAELTRAVADCAAGLAGLGLKPGETLAYWPRRARNG